MSLLKIPLLLGPAFGPVPGGSLATSLRTTQDTSTLEQLLDPTGPQYVFARDDLHGMVVKTMYVGQR